MDNEKELIVEITSVYEKLDRFSSKCLDIYI